MRARSLNCRNCGGRTRIEQAAQEALCLHCGQTVRLSEAILEEQNRASAFPPMTPLRPGMKAQFRGREYEATGRQVFRQTDEGTVYQWEEWVLIAPDGHLLYLEYDEGKWKVSEPFIPEQPLDRAQLATLGTGGYLSLDDRGALITDAGISQVVHVEGEFPYLAQVGKTVNFLDATSGSTFYSVERTDDAVEYYRGQFLDERQVYSIFGLHHLVREVDRREAVLRSRRWFGGVLLGAGALALIFWMAALGGGGKVVTNGTGTVQLSAVTDEGTRFGPMSLTAVNRVYRLDLRGTMSEQSNWVAAVLEDENQQELIPVDKDMWDESGHDSDGYWHESDLHAATHFVVTKPGNYYVRMYAEPEPGRTPSGVASFTLREQVMYPSYFGWYGWLAVIAGVIFMMAGSPQQTKAMWEGLKSSSDD